MRALIIGPDTKEQAQRVMAYARKHIYHPSDDSVPGDDERFVLHCFDGYKCVFTYTQHPKKSNLFRHLSVSVDGPNYPSPEAVFAIAELFEFTGAEKMPKSTLDFPRSWFIDINRMDHCIVVVEELK